MDFELDEDALMYGEHTARSADVSDEELESGACCDDGVSSNADTDTVDNMDRETGLSVGAGSSGVPPIPEHEVSLGGVERRATAITMTSRIKFDEASSCEPIGGVKMGSSAPISIPGLKARSNASNAPPNLDNPKLMATTFVPPHMMETGEFGYGWDGGPTSDAQPQGRSSVVACAYGRHSANVAAALLLERPRPADDDPCLHRRTHPSDDPPPRLVSTTPAAPKQRAVKYSGPPASAASAGYAALAAAFSSDASVARGLPEVCEEVDEVQERDGNEQRRVSRSNRRSLRKALAVPGYQHAVVPLQGLRRGLRKVTGSSTSEAAAEGPEGAAGTSGKSAAGEESPSRARQTLERSWSACSALDSMDMVSPSMSKRRVSMSGSRRTPRAARGVSRRALARHASAAVPVAPLQPVFAPTSEDYQKYSPTTLQLMTGVSRVLFALSKTPSRGKKSARNIVGLLASSKPRDLMREEECTLLRAVKQGMSLKALARSRKAQGKDCTHEAVATIAGLPGGADELIMLDRLAEDAAEMLISQNIGLVMSLAHKYAASSSGGVGYEDLIPFGIQGLNKAMERFDHTRGTRFSTYAHWWIRQACMRGMSVESRVVKVPAWITETAGRILREMAVVRADPDVPQSAVLGEVAKRMEMTQEKVESVLAHVSNATSLDEPASSNGKGKLDGDRLEAIDVADALGTATEPTPEEVVESNGKDAMLRDQIEELLSQLHPRERHIIKMRHGLHSSDETGLTFTEIGIAYARTQERIRQIEDKAMRRLKYLVQQKNDPELAKHLGL